MPQTIPTVCARDCYDTCALLATVDDNGTPVRLSGDPADPITRGTLCPRGAADLKRLGQNRIDRPHIRRSGRLVPADWDDALDRIAGRLGEAIADGHPERNLLLDYAGNMGLLTTGFPRRLWHAIGATMTDGGVCSISGKAGIRLHYGTCHGIDPVDLPGHPLLVFWGFNAAVSAAHLWRMALSARKERGARIVVVDPVGTPTAAAADIWLRPRPGSDTVLAYGVINALVSAGAHDEDFISRWTAGFDALAETAAAWTPDAVRRYTGVAESDLARLATAYADHRPSATLIGIGLQKHRGGADQVRAVSLIPALLGRHRGFFYSSGDAHEVDGAAVTGKSLAPVPSPKVSQVGLGPLVDRGDFQAIFVSCMNPAVTLPDQTHFRRGLRRPDVFVAVHDTHWTRTCDFADVVLPALSYLEKDDLVIPWGHSRVRRSRRIAPPITQGRDEVALMQALARRLGKSEAWLYENPWNAVERALDGQIADGTTADLLGGKTCRLKRRPADHYPTPSGKIELVSKKAAAEGIPPLPAVTPATEGGWVMLNSALPAYSHSQFQDVYGPIPATAAIHPEDAAAAGIADGDAVTLTNTGGGVTVTATVTDMVPRGAIWCPRQFEDDRGTPQNVLTDAAPQNIGGGSTFNATRVVVQKAS